MVASCQQGPTFGAGTARRRAARTARDGWPGLRPGTLFAALNVRHRRMVDAVATETFRRITGQTVTVRGERGRCGIGVHRPRQDRRRPPVPLIIGAVEHPPPPRAGTPHRPVLPLRTAPATGSLSRLIRATAPRPASDALTRPHFPTTRGDPSSSQATTGLGRPGLPSGRRKWT